MIAAVSLPAFAVALARHADPAGPGPLLLTTTERQRERVAVACAAATRAGVRPGMTPAQALARCPLATIQPLARAQLDAGIQQLTAVSATLTPRGQLRSVTPDLLLLLDLGRAPAAAAAGWIATLQQAFAPLLPERPVIGIAGSPLLATLAAHQATPTSPVVVPPAAVAAFLAACPLTLLPDLAPCTLALRTRGIRSLGALVTMPPEAVAAHHAATLLPIWRTLRGAETLLPYWEEPPLLTARLAWDGGVITMAPLATACTDLAQQLATQLAHQGMQARRLVLSLTGEDGPPLCLTHTWSQPVAAGPLLHSAALALLEAANCTSGVVAVQLTLGDLVAATPQQATLWDDPPPVAAPPADLLVTLQRRFGAGSVLRLQSATTFARLPDAPLPVTPWEDVCNH